MTESLSKKLAKRFKTLFTRQNRLLLHELIRTDIKVRDHNSILGALWSLIGPVALAIIMYLIFRMNIGSQIEAYPLYLLVGIVFVNYFITSTSYLLKVFHVNKSTVLETLVTDEHVTNQQAKNYRVEVIFGYIFQVSGIIQINSRFLDFLKRQFPVVAGTYNTS